MIYLVMAFGLIAVIFGFRSEYWRDRCIDEQEKLTPLFQEAIEKSRLYEDASKEIAGYKDTCLRMASRPVIAMMSNEQMQQLAHVIMSGLKPKEWIN